jgi:hypothetical protein
MLFFNLLYYYYYNFIPQHLISLSFLFNFDLHCINCSFFFLFVIFFSTLFFIFFIQFWSSFFILFFFFWLFCFFFSMFFFQFHSLILGCWVLNFLIFYAFSFYRVIMVGDLANPGWLRFIFNVFLFKFDPFF